MAKSPHIRLMNLSGGENSRDSIHELEENQVAEMVNLVPGDVLSPRGGCPVTGAYSREIDWIYPFRDNQGSKLSVAKAGTDLVQITPAGQITTLKEGETVGTDALLATIDENAGAKAGAAPDAARGDEQPGRAAPIDAESAPANDSSTEVIVPTLGESVSEATVSSWYERYLRLAYDLRAFGGTPHTEAQRASFNVSPLAVGDPEVIGRRVADLRPK